MNNKEQVEAMIKDQQQRPMLPSDSIIALSNEIKGLRSAQECLQKIVDALGMAPDEQGTIGFDSIIDKVLELINNQNKESK